MIARPPKCSAFVMNIHSGRLCQKTHHVAHLPHEVSTPFHRSHQMINHPSSLAKILSKRLKKCQITSPHSFLVVDVWKYPLFLAFTMLVQLVRNPLKFDTWLSLLVDFGQVPPGWVWRFLESSQWLHPVPLSQPSYATNGLPLRPGRTFSIFFYSRCRVVITAIYSTERALPCLSGRFRGLRSNNTRFPVEMTIINFNY